jgi:hypothetical protein
MQITVSPWNNAPHVPDAAPRSRREKPEPALDPIATIRLLLANGPMPASEFRRQCRQQGVRLHDLYKLAKQAGAKCRKAGPVGPGGYWVWELQHPDDFGLIRRPRRRGYYVQVWRRGRLIQKKLADDLETARARLADLLTEPT